MSAKPSQTVRAQAHSNLLEARNTVMSAIVKLRGGHAAVVDECDEAIAGLDIAITRLLACLPVEDTPQGCPSHICAICYHEKDTCSHCDVFAGDPRRSATPEASRRPASAVEGE